MEIQRTTFLSFLLSFLFFKLLLCCCCGEWGRRDWLTIAGLSCRSCQHCHSRCFLLCLCFCELHRAAARAFYLLSYALVFIYWNCERLSAPCSSLQPQSPFADWIVELNRMAVRSATLGGCFFFSPHNDSWLIRHQIRLQAIVVWSVF